MLQVTEEPAAARAKWIYTGIAYLALAFSVTWSLVQPEIAPRPWLTVGLSAVAAVWLAAIARWWPVWSRNRVWGVVAFVGLVALSSSLMASSEAFIAFVWIGFPYAFAIFPARWAVFAVAANATSTFVVQNGAVQNSSPYVVMLAIAGPVIFAGGPPGTRASDANAPTPS